MNNENFYSFNNEVENTTYIKFYLENDDTLLMEGSSVTHIFFELNRRFPEGFKWKSMAFSGKDTDECTKNMQTFFRLIKKYNNNANS